MTGSAIDLSEYISSAEIEPARQQLSDYVMEAARRLEQGLDFGWRPCSDAPSNCADLAQAFARSQDLGCPPGVSDAYTGFVILTAPESDMAFRFVHDCAHVRPSLNFSARDEYELALRHLDELHRAGFSTDSVEYQMLRVDLLGLDVGILTELRRIS